ncbi:MAG: sulfotransferase domain-containing protein [Acetobacteraceae bacterium]|nr:sulfotransferase domain-containing protein [Acetobacteraceae bacterium]
MFRQVPPEAFRLVTVLVHPFDLLAELHSGRHAPGGAAEEDPALPEDISAFYEALRGRKDWRLRPQSDRLRAAGQAHPEPELLVASDLPGGFARLRARLGLPDAVLPDAPPPAAPIRLPAELRAALRRDFAADLRLLKTLGAEEPVAPEPAAPPRRCPAAAVPPAGPPAYRPGLYLSYGVTKTGSTLAFELVRAILEQAGADQSRLPDGAVTPGHNINFFAGAVSDQIPAALEAAASRGGLVAIKTHGRPESGARSAARRGRLIGHVVFRDPRDIVLSMLDAGARAREAQLRAFSEIVTLDDALRALERQVSQMQAWLEIPGMMPLLYDRFAFDLPRSVRQLARQLGIEADADAVIAQVEKRFTQKNKAVPSRHEQEMDPADQRRVLERFGGVYARFRELALAAEAALIGEAEAA